MSARHFNTVDEFLGHKTNAGGSKFLKGWREDGKLYAWLHTLQLPIGLWRHNFPMLILKEDKDTRKVERHVWGQSLNCLETEEVLLEQNFRDKNTNERKQMPTRCPCCRFVECIWQMVKRGDIGWTDVVLRYDGADNPKENRLVHAAGVYNGFSDFGNKLTDEQKAEIKKAGIFLSDAWQENVKASLNYVFTLVNNDKVQDGVQVTIERQALGDAVKKAINDTLESKGVEAGNPITNPYCLEFTYNKDAKINDKYGARRIERFSLTPEIEELIRSTPPDLTRVIAPYDIKEFRAQLEKHLTIDIDLDWVFDVEPIEDGERQELQAPTDEEREPRPAETKTHAPAPKPQTQKAPESPKSEPQAASALPSTGPKPGGGGRRIAKAPEPPKDEPGPPCDKCNAPMTKKQTKCTGCGTEYEVDDEPQAPPPQQPQTGGQTKSGVPF